MKMLPVIMTMAGCTWALPQAESVAAPASRLAPRLQNAIEHYEKNILPAVERGELK